MDNHIIRVENLRRDFQVGGETVHALRGVTFSVAKGEFVTIMGTSGSGKSTLLNILGCLDTPTSGEYWLDGVSVREMGRNDRATLRNRKIGFVFQSYNLLPKTTALENVELPLFYNPDVSARERRERATEALKEVGLSDRIHHRSNQMSGGQQQRVAVARALVMNPEVLLLDEPLSNLDAKLRESVRVELRDIQKKMGLSTIYVTHDQSEALSMSDMIVVLKGGVVHQTGSPQEIYFEPKTPFVADFIGTTNLLSVKGLGENTVSYGNDRIPTAKSVNAGQEYCLSIRPECLKLVKEAVDGQVNVKVTIQNKMFLGEKIRYFVNDSLGKEWIIDIYDPGRTILEGEAYAAFPFEKAWLIEDLTD